MLSKRHGRKAVAPVIATLLMIAVAVAMSVIIFMWSQGFLSQTSSATGGQQGAQNQAAQSSISIETATFSTSTTGSCGSFTGPCATTLVRNVGAVSVTLGSVVAQGISSNAGYSTSTLISSTPSGCSNIVKGGSCTVNVLLPVGNGPKLTSGDVINIKVSTTVGTFAQAQFTVP